MFLLFTDPDANPTERSIAHLARSAFVSVFDEIGDVALIDTYDELIKATDAGPEKDNLLIVPFGMSATLKCADLRRTLPIIPSEQFSQADEIKNAISVIRLTEKKSSAHASHINGQPKGAPSSTDDLSQARRASGNQAAGTIDLQWPLWSAPEVRRLRGRQLRADKSITVRTESVLIDSNPDNITFDGVVFAASRTPATIADDKENLISIFLDTFRHNPDALLRISVTCPDAEDFDRASIQNQFANIFSAAGEFACRVVAVLINDRPNSSSDRFDHASFYIPTIDLYDFYDAVGYFCSQAPPLISQEHLSLFGLSADYPLARSDDRSLSALLKDAFHIARTAPDGYQQLRRYAIDNARERFSGRSAAEELRLLFNGNDLRKVLPSIDARRDREAIYTQLIGLFDYNESGWLKHDERSVAPGFEILSSDIVVDVGSGGGGFSRFCSTIAGELTYCDIDPNALKVAGQHIEEVATCPVRGVLTSGEHLGIDSEYADKIMCTEVLEHVQDPAKVVSELFRIGKPGALYLISVPDTIGEKLQKPIAPPVYFEPPNHIRIFEREAFKHLIENAGFEIINAQYHGFYHVFHWLIKWCDDPALEYKWARLWKQMLDNRMGPATKASLDQQIAKSQSILARKPLE
ncbi:MAG: class I SAM-dependent methyltransferase [Pseudomonadota bacterium]